LDLQGVGEKAIGSAKHQGERDLPEAIVPDLPLTIIVGNYGSGKSEISVNVSLGLAAAGHEVRIADLDIVNPYFRCREARETLESMGVGVLAPPGEAFYSDIPVIIPEIRGAIERPAGFTIFDVGGDDAGARVLSYFADVIAGGSYELLFVVNTSRPFTSDADGIRKVMEEIETAARLQVTAFAANTHLMDETVPETVLDGYRVVRDLGRAVGVPVKFCAVETRLLDEIDRSDIDVPILPIERFLLPPFARRIRKSPLYYL